MRISSDFCLMPKQLTIVGLSISEMQLFLVRVCKGACVWVSLTLSVEFFSTDFRSSGLEAAMSSACLYSDQDIVLEAETRARI